LYVTVASRAKNNKNNKNKEKGQESGVEGNRLFNIDESLPSFLHVPFKELKCTTKN